MMRIRKFRNLTIIFTFIIMITFSIISPVKSNKSANNEIKLLNPDQTFLVTYDPIYVNSNQNLLDVGFSGNGTLANPIIIEDLQIVNNFGSCLTINHVSLNFIIRNCYLETSSRAIDLDEIAAEIVQIYNNSINLSNCGIDILNCSKVNISLNTFIACQTAIKVSASSQLSIILNFVKEFKQVGIEIYDCFNVSILNNTCIADDEANFSEGIRLLNTSTVTLKGNNCSKCGYNLGIQAFETNYNFTIENNFVNSKFLGFFYEMENLSITVPVYGQLILQYCNNVTISNQTITNTEIGMDILECNQLIISNNIFKNNRYESCVISLSTNVNFTSNTCENSSIGLMLRLNEDCKIKSNKFINIEEGIYFSSNSKTTIFDNVFTNSSLSFALTQQYDFSENSLYNNTVNNRIFGFFKDERDIFISDSIYEQLFLINCSNVDIQNLFFSDVYKALHTINCTDINILDSNFNNNHYAVFLVQSSMIEVSNCVFMDNRNAIFLMDCTNLEISRNDYFNNKGIAIYCIFSSTIDIKHNLIHNSSSGIVLFGSYYAIITFNTIQYCNNYCIKLLYSSSYNKIFSNNFIFNNLDHSGSQAYDEGYYNVWHDALNYQGNYWSNWQPIDGNYYQIDGSAGSRDNYPNNTLIGEYSSEIWFLIITPNLLLWLYFKRRRRTKG
ncbi:MAG: right-handed parallel beta-helix repeat-containing protein [Candidatus Heimdallarchaeota archaeon]|nr:right-handed parallel beta-helix repeat-containing protein [Candidatus Heimdallarchaeota archaeon]